MVLEQAALQGEYTCLIRKLTALWHMATGQITENVDMLNMTRAVRLARSLDWRYWLGDEHAMLAPADDLHRDGNVLTLSHASLDAAFNAYGNQIGPIKVSVKGNLPGPAMILKKFQWDIIVKSSSAFTLSLFTDGMRAARPGGTVTDLLATAFCRRGAPAGAGQNVVFSVGHMVLQRVDLRCQLIKWRRPVRGGLMPQR